MRPVIAGLLTIVFGLSFLLFQSAAAAQSLPAFEVASVRPSGTSTARGYSRIRQDGRVTFTNVTLRRVVIEAYEIEPALAPFLLLGGSDELMDARFDIVAQPSERDGADEKQGRLMLRRLLADRFGLRMHAEKREVPAYALTAANDGRLGPDLRRADDECARVRASIGNGTRAKPPLGADGEPLCMTPPFSSPAPGVIRFKEMGPLSLLVAQVQAFADRPVVDQTGLQGNFEWSFEFSMSALDAGPSLFAALQRQLGLKMEEAKQWVDAYIIDSVQEPTPN